MRPLRQGEASRLHLGVLLAAHLTWPLRDVATGSFEKLLQTSVKLGGPCLGCPHDKSPTILDSMLESLIFGNSHLGLRGGRSRGMPV